MSAIRRSSSSVQSLNKETRLRWSTRASLDGAAKTPVVSIPSAPCKSELSSDPRGKSIIASLPYALAFYAASGNFRGSPDDVP
jgi:hypothetical protein